MSVRFSVGPSGPIGLVGFVALLAMSSHVPRACAVDAADAGAGQPSFLIVNPAGRGNQGMADGFLSDFSRALEAGWPATVPFPGFRGRYHVSEPDALASIRRDRPAFALVSPGFYLAHRRALDLHVLLEPVRDEGDPVVHLLARPLAPPKSAPARIGGQLAGEPDWLQGAVFESLPAGLLGSRPPVLVPVSRSLEAIRMGERGELDFVVLHDAEWRLLQRLGKGAEWRVAWTSGRLPEGPVVSFGAPSELSRAAAASMTSFTATGAGRAVLERMTLRGFGPGPSQDWERLAKLVALAGKAP